MALTQVDQGLLGTYAQYTGFKNRIINGAMVINQRGWSGTITTDGTYTLDRFQAFSSAASKYSVAQSSTAPAGYINSLLVTSLAATSVGATDYYFLRQCVEGLNCTDLGWGAVGASTVTLSFWVRSSLTGTFGGTLENNAQNRSYPFSYTISSANTWEQKTITVAGDTTGTWLTTNGIGIMVQFGLGVGTTYSDTAGAWTSKASAWSATGATSVVGTSGATFYITGVQLEKGSTATSFDYRPYGTELQLCQRYCQKVLGVANQQSPWVFSAVSTTEVTGNYQYVVPMRTAPSLTTVGSSFQLIDAAGNVPASGTIGLDNTNDNSTRVYSTGSSSLTQFRTYWMRATTTSSYYLFTAEL